MSGARAFRRQCRSAADKQFIVIRESTRACAQVCPHGRAEAVPGPDPREPDTAAARARHIETPPPRGPEEEPA
ncbi:hypothetical protein JS756_10000 [Streptomyces actuosus]|uniref:4Fe-4S Wbl-type domain-containing protein n=1 Tax=Streptomyces actuosus TaxID=1885 RepID=A0ABS2VMW7_STRAS|nr:hypothetical protein [Streptomyces actuosus]MBN0044440.1 hypothetical protein [Streptomyces actuosus]